MLIHTTTCLLGLLWAVGRARAQFDVHWNVPTFMCQKYGIFFNATRFGISQNHEDQFRGDSMVILYDPGQFPAFLSDEPQEEGIYESIFGRQQYSVVARNGGLPQLGNLSKHLEAMRATINELIPDPMFSGRNFMDIL
jgi:hyaluronoglucosaminidase